ncbi:MAG: hypothetical protein L0G99_18150, partial [Propionibacteriales bacterium]|nr:hypothetical protein [Propionibacteriales bacterium]
MADRDVVLLETVKTHRTRLVSAFVFGELTERRVVNNNVKRLIGGTIIAAILCAVCGGFSFVTSHFGRQADQERVQQGMGPATGPVLAADAFDRDLTQGWGESNRGGRWAVLGSPGAYRIGDGAAVINSTDRSRGAYLPSIQHDRLDVTTTVRPMAALPKTNRLTVIIDGRRISATQGYQTVVGLTAGGGITISLVRTSTSQRQDRQQSQISTTVTMPGADDAGEESPPVAIRTQALGTNPTTLRAKAWIATGAEPKE